MRGRFECSTSRAEAQFQNRAGNAAVKRCSTPNPDLLYETLADSMNEIRVGRLQAGGAHLQSHLAPMIGRVHEHMGKHVLDTTGPGFALAVAIVDLFFEVVGR